MQELVRVLIIEDEPGMRSTLSDILRKEGDDVKSFEKGRDGLAWIEKNPFDVAIVDIHLPDIDGMKIMEQIRLINPEAAVIIITGYSSVESAVKAMTEGAYAYMPKPFSLEEIKAIVKKAARSVWLTLENKRLIDELQHANRELEKANLRLKEVDRRKSEFLSTVSHALRTPLTSVKSFVQILLKYENENPVKQREFLGIIDNETDRLTRLINQLLNLEKMEQGELERKFAPCDILNVVRNSINKLEPLIKEKNITAALKLPSRNLTVNADEDKLNEVLMNLIGNTVKFTYPKGKITIEAKKKADTIRVSVADTGIGIPKNELGNIFERFRRLDNPVNRKITGSGLGLYICRQIIEKHKGEIWAESQDGKGSKFTFALPEYKEEDCFLRYLEEQIKITGDGKLPLSLILVEITNSARLKQKLTAEAAAKTRSQLKDMIARFIRTTVNMDKVFVYKERILAIVLPGVTKEAGKTIEDRLINVLSKTIWVKEAVTKPSLKFGIAAFPVDAENKEELIKIAIEKQAENL